MRKHPIGDAFHHCGSALARPESLRTIARRSMLERPRLDPSDPSSTGASLDAMALGSEEAYREADDGKGDVII